MTVLFTQNWDINANAEEEYDNFIIDYIAQCNKMGLRSVGGFYVEVGFGPRIVSLKCTDALSDLLAIIGSEKFLNLNRKLKEMVIDYRSKIQVPAGRVKQENYVIQKGVWKYNQYYDIIPGKKSEYADFVIKEHLPVMDKFDFVEVTGGWNVIYGGTCEIIAEFTFKTATDIGRLLDHPDFREITRKLRKQYVRNYASRIMRTTERFDEPRWYRL